MPPKPKRKYTRMTSEIATQIREAIEDAPGQHLKRAEILKVIGLDKGQIFNNWAKRHLQNLGRKLGYGLVGIDYSEQAKAGGGKETTHWSPEDYMRLSKEYVEAELMEPGKVKHVDPLVLGIALARAGITKPVPKGLKTAVIPYLPSAKSEMVLALLTSKEVVKEVKVPTPLNEIPDEDFLRELHRRLPAILACYKNLPVGFIAPMPLIEEPPAPKKTKVETFNVVVVGIHPPDRAAFERRTKIKAQLDHHRLCLIYGESGRPTPTGDFTMIVGDAFRGVYKNLRRVRGEAHVGFATSASMAEPAILQVLPSVS